MRVDFSGSTVDDYAAKSLTAGEPAFTLRGDDPTAPMLLELWAEMAKANGLPVREYRKAMNIAARMREWRRERRRPAALRQAA